MITQAYDKASGEKTPWNPSRTAIKRVRNPLPAPTTCRYCGGEVKCVSNAEVYGQALGYWPWMYRCQNASCGAYVGLHPHTAIPLGTLADKPLRDARRMAKDAFNPLWQGYKYAERRKVARSAAYAWLAAQLDIPVLECHFAWFELETCYVAADLCSTTTWRPE